MDDLEEKIFELVYRATEDETGYFNATDCTKAILAIPEIAEALSIKARLPELLREAEEDQRLSTIIDTETRG